MKQRIAILYHIFYEDSIYEIPGQLKSLEQFYPYYFFNICNETPEKASIKKWLRKNFPDCLISFSSNQGKDIGAKLLMIDLCIKLDINPGWIVFLHDKKSLQALNAKFWKEELMSIVRSENA